MKPESVLGKVIDYATAERLIGSSNYNFVVHAKGSDELALVTLYNSENFWKIGKNRAINGLLQASSIPSPRIKDSGEIDHEKGKVGFVVREYIKGQDLHQELTTFSNNKSKFTSLVNHFGRAVGILHSIRLPSFGNIVGTGEQPRLPTIYPIHSCWGAYLDSQVTSLSGQLGSLEPNKRIGLVTSDDVIQVGGEYSGFYIARRDQLHQTTDPRLIHNDLLLKNVLVARKNNQPSVFVFVDFEWAISGDPAIDLAQIENWVEFTPYKSAFYEAASNFLKGYIAENDVPINYRLKKDFYYYQRSLAYLLAAFRGSFIEEYRADPQMVGYVETHFDLLTKVLGGRSKLGGFDI